MRWGLVISIPEMTPLATSGPGLTTKEQRPLRLTAASFVVDSRLNSCRIIPLWPAGLVLRTFGQYLIVFCSRLEAVSDVVSGRFVRPFVPFKCLKFRDPRLNYSREIPFEAVGSGIFNSFSWWIQTRRSDNVSGIAVKYFGRCPCKIWWFLV